MSVNTIQPNATSTYSDSPVNGAPLLYVAWASLGIAIVTVGLRIYCRQFLTKKVWWDDALIMLALLPSIMMTVDVYYAKQFGYGHHAVDIPPKAEFIHGFLKTLFVSEISLIFAGGFTKCSILFFYLRITAGGAHQTLRRVTMASLALIISWMIALLVVTCVQCFPMHDYWSILDHAGRAAACQPWSASLHFFWAQGITNTIGDFLVVLLPIKHIISLKLPRGQKVIVLILFLLGILASITGMLRIIFTTFDLHHADNTWGALITMSLTALEMNTGVICASVPAIKPLAIKLFPSSMEDRSDSMAGYQSSIKKLAKSNSNADSGFVEVAVTPEKQDLEYGMLSEDAHFEGSN